MVRARGGQVGPRGPYHYSQESLSRRRERYQLRFEAMVEGTRDWPTPFAEAMCLGLVRQSMSPADLAREVGVTFGAAYHWYHNGALPKQQVVRDIESALSLADGELERSIPDGERARLKKKGILKKWATRRGNNPGGEFEKKFLEGAWTGNKPWVEVQRLGTAASHLVPRGPFRFDARVRTSVAHLIKMGEYWQEMARESSDELPAPLRGNFFALCVICRKVLTRREGHRVKSGQYFHIDCRNSWLTSGGCLTEVDFPRGTKTLNFRMFTFWLESEILSMGYQDIVEQHKVNYRDVVSAVERAEDWLPPRWGQFMSDTRASRGTHRVSVLTFLKDLEIKEVVEIARGQHPLSGCTDNAKLKEWADSKRIPVQLWRVGPHNDNPLANHLAERVDNRFTGKHAAAKAVGIHLDTLNVILFGKGLERVRGRTAAGLSGFLGKSVPELKAMLGSPRERVPNAPSAAVARMREIEMQRLRLDAEEAKLHGAKA